MQNKNYKKTNEELLTKLPYRNGDLNKGNFGRALLYCGSYGMAGAAILSAKACLKTGVGLCELFIPKEIYTICATSLPECVFTIYDTNDDVDFIINKLNERVSISDACLAGCGIGVGALQKKLVYSLITNTNSPLILDADALNNIKYNTDILLEKKGDIFITPHPAEMSRLTNLNIETIINNRVNTALEFSNKYNIRTLLKGANTVIAQDKDIIINTTGNAGMATGGSGDVLSGIIVSLAAQNTSKELILPISAYIHGLAGDIAAEKLSRRSMLPSDIIACLHDIFLKQEKKCNFDKSISI